MAGPKLELTSRSKGLWLGWVCVVSLGVNMTAHFSKLILLLVFRCTASDCIMHSWCCRVDSVPLIWLVVRTRCCWCVARFCEHQRGLAGCSGHCQLELAEAVLRAQARSTRLLQRPSRRLHRAVGVGRRRHARPPGYRQASQTRPRRQNITAERPRDTSGSKCPQLVCRYTVISKSCDLPLGTVSLLVPVKQVYKLSLIDQRDGIML